uniref:Phosphoinositide 3-kinase adapter protein 1 n=1 Tax=Cacopsylla melanoneura TaxID=428564 RepID=A0A8D8LE23_9HEMI
MALDNPSYFTLPGTSKSKSSFSLLKKKTSSPSKASQRSNSVNSLTAHSPSKKLTRSQSATSDVENHLLCLGNPRPSDIDPSMKYVHRRSNSVSQSQQRSSLSSANEKFAEVDMVHLTGDDDGEVFLSSFSDVKYYNVPSKSRFLGPNKRRHSIGGYLHKDSQQLSAPSGGAEHKTESARRRSSCSKCHSECSSSNTSGARCGDLMDITVLSCGQSDTASLWVRYLSSCFQQIAKEQNRPPFKLLNLCVEDILSGLSSIHEQERCAKSRLQVWVLCPKYLARLQESQGHGLNCLNTVMRQANVLALLLGVSEETINTHHKNTLFHYDHWKRLTVKDQDPTFVGDVLGISMDILSRSWQNQADSEKAHFSLIPKKIKVGQSKVIILMNEPLEAEDHIKVSVDKNGHRLEVVGVKRRNPYTLQFAMPATCLQISILVTVYVEKNGEPMGHKLVKCESRMRELDQLLKTAESPLQFLCQTLGVSPGDRDQIDNVLVTALQKNMPPHFNLLQPHGLRHHYSSEEFPTLLHFAAKFGLEKLCWTLLECPGGEQSSQLRNVAHLTPSDMADRFGHHKLADALKGHLQMTELTSMYTYLKGISNQQGFNDSNYLIPRPLHESYIVPPSPRPVLSPLTPSSPFYTNLPSYQVPPSPIRVSAPQEFPSFPSYMDNYKIPAGGVARPFSPSASPTEKEHPSIPHLTPFGAYLEMQANQSFGVSSANHLRPNLKLEHHEDHDRHVHDKFSTFGKSEDNVTTPCSPMSPLSDTLSHSSFVSHWTPSPSVKSSGVQEELIEIINDFKNNVLTISEVENLVENWRSRNDVQQSFIEKQEQLNEMRKEYDRIQQTFKDHLKRPTPFERIRKFFSRSKSKHSTENVNKAVPSEGGSAVTRPISSLSINSSSSTSSTGRISTGSGTSLGDSGTHSDHDDRKTNENQKSLLPPSNHHFYSDIPFIPKPNLTKTLSMDEYKHMEKRALCNSCHDYSNVRPPLLRGNSYQEDAIAEEDTGNDVAVVEIHNKMDETQGKGDSKCNSKSGEGSKTNEQVNITPQPPVEIKIHEAAEAKKGNTTHVIPVSVEMSHDIKHKVNNSVSEDLNKATNKENARLDNVNIKCSDNEDLKPIVNSREFEKINVQCNGKNRDAFVIDTHKKENSKQEEDKLNEIVKTDLETNESNESLTDVKTVIDKFNQTEIKVNKVHELANLFEHVEDLNKSNKAQPEDLDNSFEKEFKNSCKEIKNIARNSLIKNVCDDFELNKELEPLRRFDSESTLQLSDVETETCQHYDVSNYVNIGTCRTTNL